ncbi:MAG: hypothetical protein JXA18_12120 [Chitinispirillaceae bacterium]|nr:hypothetical protein [Chitinispirillaceae bacterium]
MLHDKQSTHRLLQSAAFAFLALAAPVLSIDGETTGGKLPFETIICGSLRMPVTSAAEYWKPYPTAGVYFTMPSTIPWLTCITGGEAGMIAEKSGALTVQCMHVRFGLMVDNLIRRNFLQLRPEAGLSSMMIGGTDGILVTNTKVFDKVENEYGLYLGIEPRIAWRNVRFSLPMRFERTFSSPERFDAVIVSLLAGYHFDL